MKTTYLYIVLVVFIFRIEIRAQNYKVGVAVNKYLGSFYEKKSSPVCYPNAEDHITFPVSTITGVTTVLIFDSVSVANTIYVEPGHKIINVGDTLFITQSVNRYSFYFPAAGKVKGKIYHIGIPKIAGETYNCGKLGVKSLLKSCNNSQSFRFENDCVGVVEK